MKQASGKNSLKEKLLFQKRKVVWSEMTQTEWIRRKCLVPKKFLTAWTRTSTAG